MSRPCPRPSVCVVTFLASPYQVELFNRLAARGNLELSVVYLSRREERNPIGANWETPRIQHRHFFLPGEGPPGDAAARACGETDLLVLGYYRQRGAQRLMRARVSAGRPWVFWGERPGFGRQGIAGRCYRVWKLWPLLRSRAPIWGIGHWAVEGYAREFGTGRRYFNVPYFSNLGRFAPGSPGRRMERPGEPARRLLFSGALIPRKGVDVLAEAFGSAAARFPQLGLSLVGAGPLEGQLRSRLSAWGGRVRFLGFQPWEALPAVYHQADALVAPSRHDGWALVVPEALAAGLPVIGTTRTGAALEFIKAEVNGWLIPPGCPRALQDVLARFATMEGAGLDRMRAEAMSSVAHHQLEDGAARFEQACLDSLAVFCRTCESST